MKASEWLSSPDKWCQHAFYKDRDGFQCGFPYAVRACVSGVVVIVNDGKINETTGQLTKYMNEKYNNTWTLQRWNDDPDTTWQMVYDLLVEVGV